MSKTKLRDGKVSGVSFYRTVPAATLREVCEKAGTTVDYFRQVVFGHRAAGKALATKLVEASDGKIERDSLLYPRDYLDNGA